VDDFKTFNKVQIKKNFTWPQLNSTQVFYFVNKGHPPKLHSNLYHIIKCQEIVWSQYLNVIICIHKMININGNLFNNFRILGGEISIKVAKFCSIKLPSHIPRDLTASLLRPCYDPGRSTVAMGAAGTQRGRSEEPKDPQGADRRRIFWTCTKQSQKLCILAESWLGSRESP